MIEETKEIIEDLLVEEAKIFLCNKVTDKVALLLNELNAKELKEVSADDIKDIFELDKIYTTNCGLYGRKRKEKKQYIV